MIHVGDITKLSGANLPPVDVICGGSPCQDLSVAGQRAGLAGERSGLFMDQVRVVKEMRKADEQRNVPNHLIRPRYFVWENVPGAFSSAGGEDFRAVIEEIIHIKDSTRHVPRPQSGRWESAGAAILGNEFSLAWRVLDAQYWGVAQRRRRIFLVADFAGLTAPEILFKQDSLFGDTEKGQREGQGAATPAQGRINDAGRTCLTTWNVQTTEQLVCLNDHGGERMDVTEEITPTLRAGMGGHPPLVAHTDCLNGVNIKENRSNSVSIGIISERNQPVLFDNHAKDCRYIGPLKVAPTVTSIYGTGGNNVPLVGTSAAFSFEPTVFSRQRSDEFSENDVLATQSARQHKDATDLICQPYQEIVGTIGYSDYKGINNQFVSEDKCIIEKKNLIRRLTPLECERLQGFPDGWTLIPGASDSARYKALGNSVAIPCVDFVLRGIAYFLRKSNEEQEE